MKKLIFSLVLLTFLIACSNQSDKASVDLIQNSATANNPETESPSASFQFEQNIYDFGTITDGDVVNHRFVFKNSGDVDLIIANASASCGCTVPDWPRNPIKKGDTASINVTFNSNGKSGLVEKSITITANTRPTQTMLVIKGTVNTKQN